MNVVCIGDCGVDYYLPDGKILCGGITANFALQARGAFPDEASITVISATGNDDAATVVHRRFSNSAIECRIATLDGPSSVQYIEIEADGEKNFIRYDEGVLRDFRLSDEDESVVAKSDLRVIPVFRQIRHFFERVMAIDNAGLTAVDFADFGEHPDFTLLESYLGALDIGFFALSVENEETIKRIGSVAASDEKLFVVTLGADGSRAFQGGKAHACPAIPVEEIVDTTGAGDAFAAGFLSQYCYGAGVTASLKKGALLAAHIIQRIGAN